MNSQCNQGSVIRIMTMSRTGQSGVRFPAEVRGVSLLQDVQIGFWAHSASCSIDNKVISLEVKRSGREVDYSLPSSSEVEWSSTSASLYAFMSCTKNIVYIIHSATFETAFLNIDSSEISRRVG